MATGHTLKAFDEDLDRLRALISEMGGLAEHAIRESMRCLVERDLEGASQVIQDDKSQTVTHDVAATARSGGEVARRRRDDYVAHVDVGVVQPDRCERLEEPCRERPARDRPPGPVGFGADSNSRSGTCFRSGTGFQEPLSR